MKTTRTARLLAFTLFLCVLGHAGLADGATPFLIDPIGTVSLPVGVECVAVSPTGECAVAYRASGGLQYARKTASGWVSEPVESGSFLGYHASLAFDAQGVAHVAYSDEINSRVRYAVRLATGWQPETAASGFPSINWIRLVLDASGNPRIAFVDLQANAVQYVARSNNQWSAPDPVPNGSGTLDHLAKFGFALDPGGVPHLTLSYSSGPNFLVHAFRTTSWQTEGVPGVYIGTRSSSLAITSDGVLHIAYDDESSQYGIRLAVVTKSGSAWGNPDFVGAYEYPQQIELRMDTNGAPQVAYQYNDGFNEPYLRFASKSSGAWVLETVEAGSVPIGDDVSLVTDGVNPVIGYTNGEGTSSTLEVADSGLRLYAPVGGESYAGSGGIRLEWGGSGTITVEDTQDNGLNWIYEATVTGAQSSNSYQLPPSPFLSAHCQLRITRTTPYSRRVSPADFAVLPTNNRPFAFQSADAPGVEGAFPSAAMYGYILGVAYFDSTNAQIKLAESCSGDAWSAVPIAAASRDYCSLAYAQGVPYVAFVSATGSLMLAHRQGSTWTTETAFSGPFVAGPSLAFDAQGNPAIGFWQGNYIRYTFKSGGAWLATPELVTSAPESGHCSLAFDPAGTAHVATFSQNLATNGLAYATRGSGGWSAVPVVGDYYRGFGCSLAISSTGQPTIAYVDLHDSSNKHVSYWSNGSFGTVFTTDDEIQPYTSLALDGQGRPHIAFRACGLLLEYGPGTAGTTGLNALSTSPYGAMAVTLSPTGNPRVVAEQLPNGDLDAYVSVPDDVAPDPVTTVAAKLGRSSGTLSWMDTGDDGSICTAAHYEAREYFSPITSETAWANASTIAQGTPGSPGTAHCVDLSGIGPCTPYYFAVRLEDEAGNWSPLGNTDGGVSPCSGFLLVSCDGGLQFKSPPGDADAPATLELAPAAPNPMRESATMAIGVPVALSGGRGELAIFDVAGRRVRTLFRGPLAPGRLSLRWDGTSDRGATVGAGTYFVRLRIGDQVRTRWILVTGR